MSILDYLQRLANQIGSLINSDLQILTTLITSGWSAVIFEGAKVTVDVHSLLTDPDCGQEAQCAKLTTVLGDLATLSTQLAALGAPQQTGSPVTLPTTPPAGYGGGPTVDAIWTYVPPAQAQTTRSLLTSAGHIWTVMTGLEAGTHIPGYPWYCFAGPYDEAALGDPRPGDLPVIDPTTIHASDTTPYVWLHRAYPTGGFYNHGGGVAGAVSGSDHYTYIVDLTVQQFQQLKSWVLNGMFGPKLAIPPVWPGLAGVTFDSPTDFADVPFTVVGPMDGVVISITSVPQPNAQYGFNGTVSYRYLGSITFEDDNGDCEFAQSLGFQDAIYVPAHMNHASFCRIRPNKSGIVGTVTPWTKN